MLLPQTSRFHPLRSICRRLGFTLTELLIGFVIFAGVSIAAYKVFTSSTKKAQESQQQAKMSRSVQQFMEGFRHHIENTLQLPNGNASALKVKRPPRCVGIDEDDTMGWTLIPMPGKTVATINTASYGPNDPSAAVVNDTNKANDALVMVYMPQEAQINYLTIKNDGTPDPDPWPTIQNSSNDTIKVDSVNGLQVGDFAVISDSLHRDIIRITGKRSSTCDGKPCFEIFHSYGVSAFNEKMDHNYGEDEDNDESGIPTLYRVNLETYAMDTNKSQLMKDIHLYDDDFDPTAKTFGTKGLKLKWETIADNIQQFQLLYLTKQKTETRTPQAGIPGREYTDCPGPDDCDCENELGLPNLNNVKVAIKYLKPNSKDPNATELASLAFNPLNLKTNLAAVKTSYPGCNTSETLYNTLADGTPNPACENGKSKNCLCADRCPLDSCQGLSQGGNGNHHNEGYGGGGSG